MALKFIIATRHGTDVRVSELVKWLHALASYQNETAGSVKVTVGA